MPEAARNRSALATFTLTLCGIVVMLWPYASAIEQQAWILTVAPAPLGVLVIRALLRALLVRRPPVSAGVITMVAQLAVAVIVLTAQFGRSTALLGVIPTPATIRLIPQYVADAVQDIWMGTVPLAPTTALLFTVATATALVTVLLDQHIALGGAVLPALLIGAVGAVPTIIARGPVDVFWFVLFALMVFALLRRSPPGDRRAPRPAPVTLTALVGAAAVAGSLLIAPQVPITPVSFGFVQQLYLNPTLQLGEDLRRPDGFPVMVLATAESRAPYLRIATLSSFTGSVWRGDEHDTRPLSEGFDTPTLPADAGQYTASIRMQDVVGRWLPTPYLAVGANGVSGDWSVMPANGTIVSADANTAEQDYTITAVRLEPTLDQIRSDRAGGLDDALYLTADSELPDIVRELAHEVTATAASDYDKLIALQSWFRGEFRYSLETPVAQGFDGSGADAVAEFLTVRAGYCVHFASAFALMARALDMPSRVVVGFLPGSPNGRTRGDERLFTIDSDDLHSWPEVYFEEWGWIAFEPTASLGAPTDFVGPDEDGPGDGDGPTPTATSAPVDTATPVDPSPDVAAPEDPTSTAAPDDSAPGADAWPVLVLIGILLLFALTPVAVRLVRRAGRMARASRGDAEAAWRELEDTLVDLRTTVSDAETPRRRAARLSAGWHDGGAELDELVAAIEAARYGPTEAGAGDLAAPLRRLIRVASARAGRGARVKALWLPRSLLPGSGRLRAPILRS